jgi:hypothetical protein
LKRLEGLGQGSHLFGEQLNILGKNYVAEHGNGTAQISRYYRISQCQVIETNRILGISQYCCDRSDYPGALGTAAGTGTAGLSAGLVDRSGYGSLDATTLSTLNRDNLLDYLQRLETNAVVLGGTLYDVEGNRIGSFSEPPELTLEQSQQGLSTDFYDRWHNRYDAPWDMPPLQGEYVLIVRHDASWVTREFFLFIARITGLVIIISAFVTGATLYVLRRMLIEPILQLRQDCWPQEQPFEMTRTPKLCPFVPTPWPEMTNLEM